MKLLLYSTFISSLLSGALFGENDMPACTQAIHVQPSVTQLLTKLQAVLNDGTYDPQYKKCPVLYGTLENNDFNPAVAPFKELLQDPNIVASVKERVVGFLCQPATTSNAQLLKKYDPITFYRLRLSDFINEKILNELDFVFSDGISSPEEQLYAIFDEAREGVLNASTFKAQIQPFKDMLFRDTRLVFNPLESNTNRLKNIFLQERKSIMDLLREYDTETYHVVLAYAATLKTLNK
ncbi:MAG: hypothetical protein WCE21_03185 [Candidatus Babeliales bacterium]